jgi:hypothetical protein
MATVGTLQDQELMTESKNLSLQSNAGPETISQGEKQAQHGLRSPHAAPLQMQRFQQGRTFS